MQSFSARADHDTQSLRSVYDICIVEIGCYHSVTSLENEYR
jgi:hypothetical protein